MLGPIADRLRGIGAVGGFLRERDCQGQVAAMIIHGVRDAVVSPLSGEASRDLYLVRNGCDDVAEPSNIEPCLRYQGCQEGMPVEWCPHDEPTYEDTNHGWPSFASEALADFFKGLE